MEAYKMPQMTTGYFLRAKRNGRWQTLDIADLSEGEITEIFTTKPKIELVNWIIALAHWARDSKTPNV